MSRCIGAGLAAAAVLALAALMAAACALAAPVALPALADAAYAEDAVPDVITVQFRQGIGIFGRVAAAEPDMMVYEAFAESGADLPEAADSEQECVGWATAADATEALRASMKLSEAYRQAGANGILTLYPVFGPIARPHLTFNAQDGKTLLAEADIDSWQALEDLEETPSVTLEDEATGEPVLRKMEYFFVGWKGQDGAIVYDDQPIVADTVLSPAYLKLSISVSGLTGAAADLSGAYLLQEGLSHATDAGFRLEKAASADDKLTAAAKADGYKPFNSYQVTFGYTAKDETTGDMEMTIVPRGFGQIGATFPTELATGTEVRVYWLGADGTASKTAAKKVSSGGVSMSFSDYSIAGKGNVLIAYKAPASSSSSSSSSGTSSSSGGWTDVSSSSSTSSTSTSTGSSSSSTSTGTTIGRTTAYGTSTYGSRVGTGASSASSVGQRTYPSTVGSTGQTGSSTIAGSSAGSTVASGSSAASSIAQAMAGSGATDSDDDEDDEDDEADGVDEDGAEIEAEESNSIDDIAAKAQEILAAKRGHDAVFGDGSTASSSNLPGSKDGGIVYGGVMLVIAGLALVAWQLASRYARRAAADGDGPALFEE